MPYTNNKKRSSIIVLLPFALAFVIAFYNSSTSVVKPHQAFRNKYYNQNLLDRHKSKIPANQIPTDQVFLQKNKKIFINKACLVFKGVNNGKINLDLYVLELDPDIPYPLSLTKESLNKGVWLGDSLYKLISVKKNKLRLRIQNTNLNNKNHF